MSDERDALLLKLLDRVAFDGWTNTALAATGADAGEIARLFPCGIVDAVSHFADWADRRMEAALEGTAIMEMRVRDRITLLVRLRLEALQPYAEAVRREAAYLVARQPGLGPKLVWRSADRMWRIAGDTATDFNHYTKRALLSGVIVSTTLCWLGDASEGHRTTWDFLDRRIDSVMGIGKAMAGVKTAIDPSTMLSRTVEWAGRLRHGG